MGVTDSKVCAFLSGQVKSSSIEINLFYHYAWSGYERERRREEEGG